MKTVYCNSISVKETSFKRIKVIDLSFFNFFHSRIQAFSHSRIHSRIPTLSIAQNVIILSRIDNQNRQITRPVDNFLFRQTNQ